MNGSGRSAIRRRHIVTLVAYLETGSHAAGAHRLGIATTTSRQRISEVIQALGVDNVGQAVWMLRDELEREREERVRTVARYRPAGS